MSTPSLRRALAAALLGGVVAAGQLAAPGALAKPQPPRPVSQGNQKPAPYQSRTATTCAISLPRQAVRVGQRVSGSVVVSSRSRDKVTGTVTVTISGRASTVTLSGGRASFPLRSDSPGVYKVQVTYGGDKLHLGSSASGSYTVAGKGKSASTKKLRLASSASTTDGPADNAGDLLLALAGLGGLTGITVAVRRRSRAS